MGRRAKIIAASSESSATPILRRERAEIAQRKISNEKGNDDFVRRRTVPFDIGQPVRVLAD